MKNMSKLTASQTDQGANPAFDDVSCTSFPQFLQAVKDVKMRGPHARMRNEEAAQRRYSAGGVLFMGERRFYRRHCGNHCSIPAVRPRAAGNSLIYPCTAHKSYL
jgi:hypothetical protein